MEELGKIGIGILLFIITSITAYLFRMRQLYATSPKLYRHASISRDGSMCEVLVYNRGNQVEEDIRVDLPPELKCELIAASSPNISCKESALKIERLHKWQSASMLLLVENGILDVGKLSINSKHITGRVVKSDDNIPPNYAAVFLGVVVIFCLMGGLFSLPTLWENGRGAYTKYKLAKLMDGGWTGLESYVTSDLRDSYTDQEFPLRLESQKIDGNLLRATFAIHNKTALPLKVSADKKEKRSTGSELDIENWSSTEVAPMSSGKIQVKMPYVVGSKTATAFSIFMGRDTYVKVIFTYP
ncbi:hypothetical protein [Variovorax sp. KK3]|uniref:hypothetical protein n=1 Tax=Variovorax sp. KK3 TaxID=1855728 RepID=UPI00117F4AEB|nr:hypothetical protein [Variovorax sp. KK3]